MCKTDKTRCIKSRFLHLDNHLGRLEHILLISVFTISLILVPLLILFALAGDSFIQVVYEQRAIPFLSKLIQHKHPLEYYFAIKKEVAFQVFVLWSLAVIALSILVNLYRIFFSDRKTHAIWIIFTCCLVTTIIFLYNPELKMTTPHTFFYTGPVYQMLNGKVPPLDPMFGGKNFQYPWGNLWATAYVSKIFNITPFDSFEILNVLSLAGCLWFLYKISNLLIDNPKANILSCLFPIYCGSFFNADTMTKLKEFIPFYGGENRIFPLLLKFHGFNGIPLGLFFFLMVVYGVMKFFRKKTVYNMIFIVLGTSCCIFFYAAFGLGIIAWLGFIGILWLSKYKDSDFKAFGRDLFILILLIGISFLVAWPYLRQVSSAGRYTIVEYFNLKYIVLNFFSFLIPASLLCLLIYLNRKYLLENLDRQKLRITGCLFLSNIICYLFLHFPSNVEYKFLLLALIPFGIIGGIVLTRIQHYSKWLALGLVLLLALPTIQLCRYQFTSSSRNIFDFQYNPSFYQNGTIIESQNPEENAMYRWIRENSSVNTYYLDKETKLPVYAQRCLWVGYDTGKMLPGYDMVEYGLKTIHGYDDDEYAQRQEVAQNIFGTQESMTKEEVAAYLVQNRLFVVIRDNNIQIPLERYGMKKAFVSETGRYCILVPMIDFFEINHKY